MRVYILLQSDLISASSLFNRTFSFLNLSFSSRSSAGARGGDELEDITCSSPEFDGETIGIAIGITVIGIGEGNATVAVVVVSTVATGETETDAGDGETAGEQIFRR
jgi:hypothetical protein